MKPLSTHKALTVLQQQPEVWVHYTSSPDPILPRLFAQEIGLRDRMFGKPNGLWITPLYADDNWFHWCMAEDFRIGELNYCHEVRLAKNAKLLRIDSVEQLDQFTEKYGFSAMYEILGDSHDAEHTQFRKERRDGIRWETLSDQYDGILIPRYHWERRLSLSTPSEWYYPWDCACGCIWNPNAIESITLIDSQTSNYVSCPHMHRRIRRSGGADDLFEKIDWPLMAQEALEECNEPILDGNEEHNNSGNPSRPDSDTRPEPLSSALIK